MRKEAIDRANRLLFYTNDSVKTFHSTLLTSDVLKVTTGFCGLAQFLDFHGMETITSPAGETIAN